MSVGVSTAAKDARIRSDHRRKRLFANNDSNCATSETPFYRLQLNFNFAAASSPTPKAGRSDFHFDFGTFLEVQCQNWPWIR